MKSCLEGDVGDHVLLFLMIANFDLLSLTIFLSNVTLEFLDVHCPLSGLSKESIYPSIYNNINPLEPYFSTQTIQN